MASVASDSNFQPPSLFPLRKADTRPANKDRHNAHSPLPQRETHIAWRPGMFPATPPSTKLHPRLSTLHVPAVSRTLAKLPGTPSCRDKGQRHRAGPTRGAAAKRGTGQGEGRPGPPAHPEPRRRRRPRERKLAVTVTRHRAGTKAAEPAATAEAGYPSRERGGRGGSGREQPVPGNTPRARCRP